MYFEVGTMLFCALAISSTNSQYPSYQYCADCGAELDFAIPSYEGMYDTYFGDCHFEFNSKVYFNSSSSFKMTDFYFSYRIHYYDQLTHTYDNFYDSISFNHVSYTNEDFETFNFALDFNMFTNSNYTFQILNEGNLILSRDYTLTYAPLNNIEYKYIFNGYYLYGQIQDYILETVGFQDGYNSGYGVGYADGYNTGYTEGESFGQQEGFAQGLIEGTDRNATATTIFTGILEVGLLPVNVFLAIFNFEVFGINIGGFLASLMTIAIIVIVIRIIVGAKTGS